MSTPHLAAVLARTQRSLQAQSRGEGEQLRKSITAELVRNTEKLASCSDRDAYVGLVQEKGRLQDALVSLR